MRKVTTSDVGFTTVLMTGARRWELVAWSCAR
jgi:hypothetical protein